MSIEFLPGTMFRDQQPTAFSLQSDDCMPRSTGAEASRQPTYTTVGSIYNPNAATPIQPPTRRARTRRYPPPFRSPSSEPYLPFDNALLSALPLGDHPPPPSPPTTAAMLRQYSPLQQNYDRAVSPTAERENPIRAGTEIPGTPSIRSGNLPSPVGLEGNDSAASEEMLTSRITVKSLTNLASYANPMQKAAQKALARARTTNFGLSRSDTPSPFPASSSDLPRDRLLGTNRAAPAAAGPPQPLTAGPPGQRHYRPSSLEAASRTFQLDGQLSQVPVFTSGYHSRSSANPNIASGILATFDDDDKRGTVERPIHFAFDETYRGSASDNIPGLTAFRHLSTPGPSDVPVESLEHARPKIHDTLPPERIEKYYPCGFPHNYDGRYQFIDEDWYLSYPTTSSQCTPKPYSEQINKINQSFYAGTEGLMRSVDQFVRDTHHHCSENRVGVIGEGRERLRRNNVEPSGVGDKVMPPFLSVVEANMMDGADATKPLIDLALVTLMGYKEASKSGVYPWPCGFVKADDAWVDDSEEGNTSFFSKSKDDQKKKRIVKKPRRGY